jgi:putative phosphoesterase
VATKRSVKQELYLQRERLVTDKAGSLRIAVVADTHSALHPRCLESMARLKPDTMLHAGDIGDMSVLEELKSICPVLAIRGNIDARHSGLADALVVDLASGEHLLLRLLLIHQAVYGPKLRGEVAALARENGATLVVCGHSHVPFIGRDRGLYVFNPGSAGPRRFNLPIVFGALDISTSGFSLTHFDCETGAPWAPPAVEGNLRC